MEFKIRTGTSAVIGKDSRQSLHSFSLLEDSMIPQLDQHSHVLRRLVAERVGGRCYWYRLEGDATALLFETRGKHW